MTSVTVLPHGFVQLPSYILQKLGVVIGGELEITPSSTGFNVSVLKSTSKIDENQAIIPKTDDKQIQEILDFAGSWQDFDEDIFSIENIEQRRQLSKRVD